MIDKRVYDGLRAEYIGELTHQFELRERLALMKQSSIVEEEQIKRTERLIENSCKHCRCFDYLISELANKFHNQ